jgi:hypothetical protein
MSVSISSDGDGGRLGSQSEQGGRVHGANACDKNGGAATSNRSQARRARVGRCIDTVFSTHVRTSPLPLLCDWELVEVRPDPPGLEASHSPTGQTD